MGGKVDGRESSSTDSGVRVGLTVHSGQSAVGPVRRSASDTTCSTTTVDTRFARHHVTEIVCTLDACSHCCTCHLRHNKTAMAAACALRGSRGRTASVLASVRLAAARQPECASNHVVVDLTYTDSHSSSHSDDRSSDVPVVSSPSTPRHRLYLVCVERLAASMWTRRCVLAHKLAHTPRPLRPTVSPLPLSPTVGQQPARR